MENKTSIKVFPGIDACGSLCRWFHASMCQMQCFLTGISMSFEDGIHKGAQIYTDYVGQNEYGEVFDLTGSTCSFIAQKGTSTSVNVEVDKEGLYEIFICYVQPYDKKQKSAVS